MIHSFHFFFIRGLVDYLFPEDDQVSLRVRERVPVIRPATNVGNDEMRVKITGRSKVPIIRPATNLRHENEPIIPVFTTEKKPEKKESEKCLTGKYILGQCLCYEEFTAYYGNNHRFGDENPQKTRLACQRSCEAHPSCHFWTFRKPLEGQDTGLCYLKTKRENVTPNVTDYVSGSKGCKLPEWTGIQSDISG